MSKSECGLTLVELLAVIVILGVLAAIAVPVYLSHVERTENEVCRVNRNTIARDYEMDLMLRDRVHSEVVFREFMEMNGGDGCPVGGIYSYGDGGRYSVVGIVVLRWMTRKRKVMITRCRGCKA